MHVQLVRQHFGMHIGKGAMEEWGRGEGGGLLKRLGIGGGGQKALESGDAVGAFVLAASCSFAQESYSSAITILNCFTCCL